jgi:hypothetical protein
MHRETTRLLEAVSVAIRLYFEREAPHQQAIAEAERRKPGIEEDSGFQYRDIPTP